MTIENKKVFKISICGIIGSVIIMAVVMILADSSTPYPEDILYFFAAASGIIFISGLTGIMYSCGLMKTKTYKNQMKI